MRIVVFHKAPKPVSVWDASVEFSQFCGTSFFNHRQQVAAIRRALLEPFSDRKFDVKVTETTINIDFSFSFYGKPKHHEFNVDLNPWSYQSFWYRSGLRRIDVVNEDFNRMDALVGGLQHELADLAGGVGRVLVLDDLALLYLRGNIEDIPGFENVIVEKGSRSLWAFADYSEKAGAFLKNVIQKRRDYEQTYSLPDKVAALEKRVKELESEIQRLREQ